MNNLHRYREAQNKVSEADKSALDNDLARMSEILQEHLGDAASQISAEFGWLPPSVIVNMVNVAVMGEPESYVMGEVKASL